MSLYWKTPLISSSENCDSGNSLPQKGHFTYLHPNDDDGQPLQANALPYERSKTR